MLDNFSDEPEECKVKYEKVGCFKDRRNARALSEKIFNDRKNIDWEAGKWEKFLKRQVLEEYNSLYFVMINLGNRSFIMKCM